MRKEIDQLPSLIAAARDGGYITHTPQRFLAHSD